MTREAELPNLTNEQLDTLRRFAMLQIGIPEMLGSSQEYSRLISSPDSSQNPTSSSEEQLPAIFECPSPASSSPAPTLPMLST